MTGYRTILIGLLFAIGTPGFAYLAGIDWTKVVGPVWSVVIVAVIGIGMRFVTATPVGIKKPE